MDTLFGSLALAITQTLPLHMPMQYMYVGTNRLTPVFMAVNAHSLLQLPPEIVSLSHKCMLYRERVFQVYTLNPCFWPVRPRPLPVSHLPPTLAQFCEDFTKFFSSGLWWHTHPPTHPPTRTHPHTHTPTHTHTAHECGLQQHERPRRLQFTLHGWAVVLYEGVRLMVSTVQMCVLLQFSTSNVSVLVPLRLVGSRSS